MKTRLHQIIDWGDNIGVERVDQPTGCVDAQGRAIGYRASIRQIETRESKTGSGYSLDAALPFGTLYQWGVQMTKNGDCWGPIPRRYIATTKEEARAKAMAKMNALVKGAQKNYQAA